MTDTTWKLKKLAALAIKMRKLRAAVSLDIQNVFNLMPWAHVMYAQGNAKVLLYLCNIIRDYFRYQVVLAQIKKRDDTWCLARVISETLALEYRFWQHPEGEHPLTIYYLD